MIMRNKGGNKRIGAWGERAAADYLTRLGYRIVATNVHMRFAEIDIVAESSDNEISFIEVKTRVNAYSGEAERSLTKNKIRHLYTAARLFCLQRGIDLNYTNVIFEHISIYIFEGSDRVVLKKYLIPSAYGYV